MNKVESKIDIQVAVSETCSPKANPRCATPAIDLILSEWKFERSPYEDKIFDEPACQRRSKVVLNSK